MRSSADAVREAAHEPRRAALRRRTELGLLTAASLVLFVFESFLPSPVPWLKIGLANIVTVTVLARDGFRAALAVTLVRVVIGSLLLGSFLSPAFLLSLSGALVALAAMAAARAAAPRLLSVVGVSIVGAVGHNVGQLAVVAVLFLRAREVFHLLPYLTLSATLVGVLTGLSARALTTYLETRRGGRHGHRT